MPEWFPFTGPTGEQPAVAQVQMICLPLVLVYQLVSEQLHIVELSC